MINFKSKDVLLMELNNINLDLIINYAMIVGAIILVIDIIMSILQMSLIHI